MRIQLDSKAILDIDTSFFLGDFSVDLTSIEKATETIDFIDMYLEDISRKKDSLLTDMHRIKSAVNTQLTNEQNLKETEATLTTSDEIEEKTNFVIANILQHTSSSILVSTKNINKQIVKSLLNTDYAISSITEIIENSEKTQHPPLSVLNPLTPQNAQDKLNVLNSVNKAINYKPSSIESMQKAKLQVQLP